jgi:serine O-acetyltransferase
MAFATFRLIVEDYKRQREGLLAQGFWALLVYRFGHCRFSFKSKIIRIPIAVIHIFLSKWIEVLCGISIAPTAKIGRRLKIEHFGQIIIHGCAEIGDDCIIRQGVTIGNKNNQQALDAPIIGNKVNIGAGAKLLGKIRIHDNVSIGANSVVITDVPPNSIAVGVPAIIKERRL